MKEKIMNYVKPTDKLIWAERTKFFSLKQDKDETIQDYVTNLRKQAENCDFESLKQSSNLQESLVVHQLITGVHSRVFQERILESAASKTPTVNSIMSLIENMRQISSFCEKKDNAEILAIKSQPHQVSKRRCSFCGNSWHTHISLYPARKVKCHNCNMLGHFSNCC